MKIAKIPSFLLSDDLTRFLKLKEPTYMLIVPKSVFTKMGIQDPEPDFDLYYNKGDMSLQLSRPDATKSRELHDT